ncbi:AAA domain-containing protein [Hymenobacter sp. BT18]|uniref:McrB family protein n=1 Tax=Hymenobacter sp. BT18 TaxID=2835648 RepID=UPI00143ED895|nr:AAA family ATPase [Hymenobacter sp. BT18]QIX62734.1 AAA domain-containing protein [Hymenobacter sp. BT18]
MTVSEVKELVRTCGLSYKAATTTRKTDFDKVFIEQKGWLCNLEDKLQLLPSDAAAQVHRVIAKLKSAELLFAEDDVADLSRFISSINNIVLVGNRLNNFRQGTKLDDGTALQLPNLFNHIKQAGQLLDCAIVLNKNLKAFLPHLYSVVKHCQDPQRYPIFYKYWRNIMREVYGLSDAYDAMTQFYQELPEQDRHLCFGSYMGVTGINVAEVLAKEPLQNTESEAAIRYLREEVLNLHQYQKLLPALNTAPRYFVIGSKYGDNANESILPQMLERRVIATGFARHLDLSAYYGEEEQLIDEYLKEAGEKPNARQALKRFLSIKPGDLIAVKADGSPKQSKPFLSIVGLAKVVERDGKVYQHDPGKLGHVINVEFYKSDIYKEFALGGYGSTVHELKKTEAIETIFNADYSKPGGKTGLVTPPLPPAVQHPLNQILFGPPGTGKTYQTLRLAYEIIKGHAPGSYDEASKFFKENLYDQIELVTFHQSFTYEDFVQGIRPMVGEEGKLTFTEHKGIFYQITQRARANWESNQQSHLAHVPFETVFEEFIRPLREEESVIALAMQWQGFSYTITGLSEYSIRYIRNGQQTPMATGSVEYQSFDSFAFDPAAEKTLSLATLQKYYEQGYGGNAIALASYYKPLVEALHARAKTITVPKQQLKNYVLIIDEINRANISKVFGELITLLEPDKRVGGKHELTVRLSSGERDFGIPRNLYVIGTMNTADKSIALLDIALRRRFEFKALYPVYAQDGKRFTHSDVFEKLNERIIKLKSRDFQIGHAYFMNEDESLSTILDKKVIPLLYEYFLNDDKKVEEVFKGTGIVLAINSETGLLHYKQG